MTKSTDEKTRKPTVNIDDPGKLDPSDVIKVVFDIQVVAVPRKVVEFVDVDAVSLVRHDFV